MPVPADAEGRRGAGLVLEDEHPRLSVLGVVASLGALWGLVGYAVLWEGVPVTVQRPFVESVPGTVALLPVKSVLWGIRLAETLEHRTFELSDNHWWIAVVAGLVGTAIAVVVGLALRAAVRAVGGAHARAARRR
jgi:hypothetical protein